MPLLEEEEAAGVDGVAVDDAVSVEVPFWFGLMEGGAEEVGEAAAAEEEVTVAEEFVDGPPTTLVGAVQQSAFAFCWQKVVASLVF